MFSFIATFYTSFQVRASYFFNLFSKGQKPGIFCSFLRLTRGDLLTTDNGGVWLKYVCTSVFESMHARALSV